MAFVFIGSEGFVMVHAHSRFLRLEWACTCKFIIGVLVTA